MIAMTYRYEWRALSYAMFLHEDYPPFDFDPAADDDGVESHTTSASTYPEHLNRWKPLYKWVLAIPHYVVLVALVIAGVFGVIGGFFAVLITARVPRGHPRLPRRHLPVRAAGGGLRRASHRRYPPFNLAP